MPQLSIDNIGTLIALLISAIVLVRSFFLAPKEVKSAIVKIANDEADLATKYKTMASDCAGQLSELYEDNRKLARMVDRLNAKVDKLQCIIRELKKQLAAAATTTVMDEDELPDGIEE